MTGFGSKATILEPDAAASDKGNGIEAAVRSYVEDQRTFAGNQEGEATDRCGFGSFTSTPHESLGVVVRGMQQHDVVGNLQRHGGPPSPQQGPQRRQFPHDAEYYAKQPERKRCSGH